LAKGGQTEKRGPNWPTSTIQQDHGKRREDNRKVLGEGGNFSFVGSAILNEWKR